MPPIVRGPWQFGRVFVLQRAGDALAPTFILRTDGHILAGKSAVDVLFKPVARLSVHLGGNFRQG
jgi:hypothetical protein